MPPGRRSALAALSALVVVTGACSEEKAGGDGDSDPIPASCGLPTPGPRVPDDLVPKKLLLDDAAELTSATRERGGFLAAVNIPFTVGDGFERYKAALRELGYTLIGEDNEIFEAEMYFQGFGRIGAIQVRRSLCNDASIAFINLIDKKRLGRQIPLPVPSGARTPTPLQSP